MKWTLLIIVSIGLFTYEIVVIKCQNEGDKVDAFGLYFGEQRGRRKRDNTVYGSYYYKGTSIQTRWCENYDLQLHFIIHCNATYMPTCCQADTKMLHRRMPFCVGTEVGYRYPFIFKFYNMCAYFYHMCEMFDHEDLTLMNYPCLFPIQSIKRSSRDCIGGECTKRLRYLKS